MRIELGVKPFLCTAQGNPLRSLKYTGGSSPKVFYFKAQSQFENCPTVASRFPGDHNNGL